MREQLNSVIERLRSQAATMEEEAALRAVQYVAHDKERCLLEVKPLLAAIAREKLLPKIQASLSQAMGRPVRVHIRVARSPQRELFPFFRAPDSNEAEGIPDTGHGRTFEHFVVGPTNRFAHAAAFAVARNPGRQYNPLFLYGNVGLGKTHLLHAIAHGIREQHPALEVRYVTADAFMAEVVYAIRRNRLPHFKARFHRIDVLLVDDVQLLAGRERTQEEFFHIFNTLHESGKQIVLAADRPPDELLQLEERLRNRFTWGLVVDIQPPELETRVAILQRKAQLEGVELPYEVALTLAQHLGHSVRELHGILTRLLALASLTGADITLDLAQKVLGSTTRGEDRPVTLERIQETVAHFFGLRVEDLRSPRRSRAIATARQIAMYLCRQDLGASFPYIGECFGGRDHTTVIHAVTSIERRQTLEPELRRVIESLRRIVRTGEGSPLSPWKPAPERE